MRYNLNLGALRGLGALLIFFHHSGLHGNIVASFGDFGVSLFMMLSGFILTATYRGDTDTIPSFMKRRLMKIYPAYFMSLLVALTLCFIKGTGISAGVVLLDLLLLQSWIPKPDIYFSGNAVAWFLSSLMFCYIIFLPVKRMIIRYPVRSLTYAVILLISYFLIIPLIPVGLETPLIYIFPPMECVVFIIGIFVREITVKEDAFNRLSAGSQLMMQIVCLILATIQIFCYQYIPEEYALSSYWWITDILILTVFTLTDSSHGLITRLLHSRPLQYFGRISLCFYLFHFLVFDTYDLLFPESYYNSGAVWIKIFICFPTTVLLSIIINKLGIPKSRKQ